MRKFIAKNIGFPLQDVVKGTNILETYRFLMQSKHWDYDKLRQFQFDKFIKIIEHSYVNVPYYRDLFNNIKLKPADIKSFDDAYKIPILTKQIARDNFQKLLWPGRDLKHLKIGKTGGTTGVPLPIVEDVQTRSFTWGSYYRWYNQIGIELGDPVLTFWGASTVLSQPLSGRLKDSFRNFIQNSETVNSFNMTESNFDLILKRVNDFKPKLLKGYLSALLQFAEYIEKNNLTTPNPIALSSTTETLLKPYKDYLEKVFKTKMYDQYGCGECNAIAYECSAQEGLHITMEHVFIEILNPDNTNAGFNKGNIVLTDLDNYAMPFIRYQNGDIARLSERKCSCSMAHTLLDSIEGRATDTIILKDGSKVHGVFFTDILHELQSIQNKEILRFQVYQKDPGKIDFRIETNHVMDKDYLETLQISMGRFFDEVTITEVSKLSVEANGKFKYVISDISNF